MKNGMIKKWLLTINEQNELVIRDREVSPHAPINKVLDKVGDYSFKFIDVNYRNYLIVYETDEEYTVKTKILLGKIGTEPRQIDMIDLDFDYENALQIARDYMKCSIVAG